ncbi:MAG: hypothetical protein ACJAS1_003121 [Oleiphilaceae bacterium]|jgi:hypothetical protein
MSQKRTHKHYPKEFKEEAVSLVHINIQRDRRITSMPITFGSNII